MSISPDDDDDWDPFGDLEDREHLERVAQVRRVAPEFPRHLLTSDPAWAREVIVRSKQAKAAEKAAEKPPLPEVEVMARDAREGDPIPKAALRMKAKAEKAGWTTRLTYARGPWLGSRDRTAQADVVWLAMRRVVESIVATWRNGDFKSGVIYSPYSHSAGPNWKKITSPNIKKALEAE